MSEAVVGLGSNIDAHRNILKARGILNRQFEVIKESRFVITKPIGYVHQPDFLNGVILLRTALTLPKLKNALKAIESILKRCPTVNKFGPRTIDLDIIMWNGRVIDQEFYQREYLQESVRELFPDLKI